MCEWPGVGLKKAFWLLKNREVRMRLQQAWDMAFVLRRSLWLFQVPRPVLGLGGMGGWITEKQSLPSSAHPSIQVLDHLLWLWRTIYVSLSLHRPLPGRLTCLLGSPAPGKDNARVGKNRSGGWHHRGFSPGSCQKNCQTSVTLGKSLPFPGSLLASQ